MGAIPRKDQWCLSSRPRPRPSCSRPRYAQTNTQSVLVCHVSINITYQKACRFSFVVCRDCLAAYPASLNVSFSKSLCCISPSAVSEGSSRPAGSHRAIRPTGEATLLYTDHINIKPRGLRQPFTSNFCLTGDELLPIQSSSVCRLGLCKSLRL